MLGSSLSGGVFGSVEKHGSHMKGAINEKGLIGIGGQRREKPLQGEIDGERREFRKAEKRFEEMVHLVEILESRVLRRTRSLGH